MPLEQIEIERDDAIRAAQLGADHALFGRAIHLLDAYDGAAGGGCASLGIEGGRGYRRVAMIMIMIMTVVIVIVMIVAMVMRRLGSVPCDRLRMTAATAAAGDFRLGVVVDRQGGGEIGFHASIQNPEETSGSSPAYRCFR
ncbi:MULTISPECIES: hypothetical protein [Ralstonia]|uniref:hypothetical protein n=1 Tax=Ralstonia TaxID=48736 RepID=UPI0021566376|nr:MULTISPECIES: hypothetical protein [Ralstonia]